MPNLVSADSLARQGGVKLLVYGPPGSAKTPLCGSAPRPVLLSVEPGTRSLEGHTFPVEHTREPAKIHDFFAWWHKSNEARQFETLCIDSLTEIADVFLGVKLDQKKDGRAAYGDMGREIVKIVRDLLEDRRNLYMIAKMDQKLVASGGRREPYFPGNELSIFVPHAVDEIYYIDKQSIGHIVPGAPMVPVLCFQTFTDAVTHARSRSGKVAPYEQPNLGLLFEKIKKGK